jgi:hypothetical protein
MGVEPTLEQEAGRATVVKTAQTLSLPTPMWSTVRRPNSNVTVACAALSHTTPPFPAGWRQIRRQIDVHVTGRPGAVEGRKGLVGVEHHAAGNRSLAWATEPEEPLDR